ncbi:MAG: hypothetical protein ACOCUH_03675 [Bacteriovoracia bacterium]
MKFLAIIFTLCCSMSLWAQTDVRKVIFYDYDIIAKNGASSFDEDLRKIEIQSKDSIYSVLVPSHICKLLKVGDHLHRIEAARGMYEEGIRILPFKIEKAVKDEGFHIEYVM